MKSLLPVGLLLALISCPTEPNPQPTPTPVPTVAPKNLLLRVEGGKFVRGAGEVVRLQGAVLCCEGPDPKHDLAKLHGWPIVDEQYIDQLASFGLNWTHVRLGPHSPSYEGEEFSAYAWVASSSAVDLVPLRSAGWAQAHRWASADEATKDLAAHGVGIAAAVNLRVDLDTWNPVFWERAKRIAAHAKAMGVYLEVDLVDRWVSQHELSPLCRALNIQGVDECGLLAFDGPPLARQAAFIRKAVAELGEFDNVLWQDGNEAWKNPNASWSLAARDIVRAEETAHGFQHHPFGTNTGNALVITQVDYATFHGAGVHEQWTDGFARFWPTYTNEYDTLLPAAVMARAYQAKELGSTFQFWSGTLSEAERESVLRGLQALNMGQPNPIPTPEACPPVQAIGVSLHNRLTAPGGQAARLEVGGGVVLDATPWFQRAGPRGTCNNERDEFCGGRQCEPPDGLIWTIESGPGGTASVQNTAGCGDQCPAVPCDPRKGYQFKITNLGDGDYVVRVCTENSKDCSGKRITNACGRITFTVPGR